MAQGLTVWTNNRSGHHGEYAEFFAELSGGDHNERKSIREKLLSLVSARKLIVLDFEYSDWVLSGIIWIWAIFRPVYILSVHGEMYETGNGWRACLMRGLLRCRHRRLTTLSIHMQTPRLKSYFDQFVIDPQLMDVNFLAQQAIADCCSKVFIEEELSPVVVVLGSWGARREYSELLGFFRKHSSINFLVIAKNAPAISFDNVTVLRRYISREELYQVYVDFDFFLFRYSNSAPSGFVGRAVQFGKHIIIPRGSYLDRYYNSDNVSKSYLDDMGTVNFFGSKGRLATDILALRHIKRIVNV